MMIVGTWEGIVVPRSFEYAPPFLAGEKEEHNTLSLLPPFLTPIPLSLGPGRHPCATGCVIFVPIALLLNGKTKAEGKRRGPRGEGGSSPRMRRREEGRARTKTR